MVYNETTALALLMGRLDRPGVATPAPLTEYWISALKAAAAELTRKGILLQDTVDDTLQWWLGLPEERRANPKAGIAPAREIEVLKAWHAKVAAGG